MAGAALPVMDDGSRLVAEIAAAAMPGAKTGLGLLCCSGREDAGAGAAGCRRLRCWRRM